MISSVGIIGYGHFGSFLHQLLERFASHLTVRVSSIDREPDGALFVTPEEVASCDVLVLCVPISAYEEVLAAYAPLVDLKTIVVDVATVKVHTTALLRAHFPKGQCVATHPMFGPESYEKRSGDITGFRIVVTEHTLAQETYASLAALLRSLGFSIIEMSAAVHDKHLAETLFLTHFLGQAITRTGFDRTEIDTVSFGFLMDAVESVRADSKLFRDVFAHNPFCREALEKLGDAERSVRNELEDHQR